MQIKADDLSWTPVPSPLSETGVIAVNYNDQSDVVEVEKWYWFKIMNYIIDTEANKDLILKKR